MKSTIENSTKTEEIKYPCLMEYEGAYVVLFADCGSGTVVQSEYGWYSVGYYSDTWEIDGFKPFTGKVILEN